jgi:two-component system, cell cycle sensor histidine kinase and response regulator CckA
MTIKYLSFIMILLGAIFLIVAFSPARNILENVSGQLRRKWLIILWLMGFFLLGYLFFDIILISSLPFPDELVTGGVFLGGACFVYIIIHISRSTIAARQKDKEAIALAKDDWESTFDTVTDMITVHDLDYNIIRANPAARTLLGLSIQEGMPLVKCFRCYHGTDKPPFSCASCESLQTWKSTTVEAFEPHLNRHLEIRAMPRFGKDRQVIGLIHVVRDITEYKRMEAQLLQSQKMEAIGVLAGGVAHDFNNLLTVINGYTEMFLEDLPPDDPRHRDFKQISKAGQQAASLTSQLLAFSRKQILQPEILNINDILDETSKMLRRMIGEDIEIMVRTQPNLGLVNTDPGQVQQIILNLAVNARDAMPQGGKLTIETADVDFDEYYVMEHPLTKAGPYVMLAASDNGIGMDAATQTRIFDPFFTTKGIGKGTGLGLSTVYGIVKQSNGFIWVYSEPGKGTTFKIYLPRVEGKITKVAAENKLESDIHGFETVLVVEDEALVRSLACRILNDRGYYVLEASNGNEALRVAQEHVGEIHLILTDVVMPGMSGRELVSQLKEIRPNIKSLFISGYTDDAIVHHGILDSDVAFLQKPFTIEKLTHKVRAMIELQPHPGWAEKSARMQVPVNEESVHV